MDRLGTTGGDWSTEPYAADAINLRARLADPSINTFEHTVNEPRLLALLPLRGVRRILDFGAGDGHFTLALRRQYPDAEIVGVDASEDMLPTYGFYPSAYESDSVYFEPWDGRLPSPADWDARALDLQRRGQFDLIVAKLVLHYIDPLCWGPVAKSLRYITASGGSLLCSVPHPKQSARRAEAASWAPISDPDMIGRQLWYRHEIGRTGVCARMLHMPFERWIQHAAEASRAKYVVVDQPGDEEPRRLNMLFTPNPDDPVAARKRLQSYSGGTSAVYNRLVSDL